MELIKKFKDFASINEKKDCLYVLNDKSKQFMIKRTAEDLKTIAEQFESDDLIDLNELDNLISTMKEVRQSVEVVSDEEISEKRIPIKSQKDIEKAYKKSDSALFFIKGNHYSYTGDEGFFLDQDGQEYEFDVKDIEFAEVFEGAFWPKSKLSQTFEMLLADALNTGYKGTWYVDGYDLYQNDKKIMTIDPDKDSVETILKYLKKKGIK